jgi:hypothetical protein
MLVRIQPQELYPTRVYPGTKQCHMHPSSNGFDGSYKIVYPSYMPYKNKEDMTASRVRHMERNFQNMWKILIKSSCIDCGENDPIVLEFDHLPGCEKKFEIGRAVASSTRSWKQIQQEIDKCEIVCANCHKRRTSKRANHKRYRMLAPIG